MAINCNNFDRPLPAKEKILMFGQENIYPPVYKVVLVRERHGPSYVVHGAKAAAKVFATFFCGFDREGFAVALLDTKLKLIGVNLVSLGSLNQTVIRAPEVFKSAILANAANLILGHPHLSGDTKPSVEDRILTDPPLPPK